METTGIIEFKHVDKQYGERKALHDFNLVIKKGEFVTVIGSSGCGKTTALKMINGLNLPDKGTVLVNGKDNRHEDLITLRRHIGYSIQGTGLFPHLTVEKNICYVPALLGHSKPKRRKRCRELLKLVGLEDEMGNRYPDELSGGQQQRVGIARALAAEPDILLMDEPFGAVDEITRKQLQDEMIRIHDEVGVTVFFVTHDINEALKLGDYVLVMNEGRVVQYGTPAELLNKPAEGFVEKLVGQSHARSNCAG